MSAPACRCGATVTETDPIDGMVYCALCGRTIGSIEVNGAGTAFAAFEALMAENGVWTADGPAKAGNARRSVR